MLLTQKSGGKTARQKAVSVLKKYTGNLWQPSNTTCYSDTTGSTPAVQDGTVACIVDSATPVGAELFPSPSFDSSTGITLTAAASITGGKLVVGASVAAIFVSTTASVITAGRVYRVTYTVDSIVGDSISFIGGGVSGVLRSSAGTHTEYFVATATGTAGIRDRGSGITSCVIDNFSVREVGTIATQATAGYRPVLRKGAKNLLLNSATLSTQSVVVPAVPMTLSIYGTGSVTLSGTGSGTLAGTGAGNRVSLNFTPTAGSCTFTVSGSVTSAMLEIGSTASQYVATTSAPASNGIGSWWLDFDGSDDRLSLSAVPFGMSDDHFVVAGAKSLSAAALGQLFFNGSSSGSGRCASIYHAVGTNISALWRDDANAVSGIPDTGTNALGSSFVVSATKASSTVKARKNAGSFATASVSGIGTTTVDYSGIGSIQGNRNFFSGPIYALALGKGTISDAELRTLERYIGSLSSVSIS